MSNRSSESPWEGRVDTEAGADTRRWHQVVQPWLGLDDGASETLETVLLGFASDEGIRRNFGRTGAVEGPLALRRALANLAWHEDGGLFDAGDVTVNGSDLEEAQSRLADKIAEVLSHNDSALPIVLGGGHEVAWGTFQGLMRSSAHANKNIGIINLDAHFDLRSPNPQSSSGTPFWQIADWCKANDRPFHYSVFGISPPSNTTALFEKANDLGVLWVSDVDCVSARLDELAQILARFIPEVDGIYLTICLDAFSAPHAPGVSAPSSLGIQPMVGIQLIREIRSLCEAHGVPLVIADIAELSPRFDIDSRTAKLAARMVYELVNS